MVTEKFTFNPEHTVIVHSGGAGNTFRPTYRLFLVGSPAPTKKDLEESAQRIKSLVGKIRFPFRFDPLGGSEV